VFCAKAILSRAEAHSPHTGRNRANKRPERRPENKVSQRQRNLPIAVETDF